MAASLRTSYIPKSDVWTMPNMSLRGTTEWTFFYARAVPARLSDIVQFNSSTAVRSVRPVSGGFRSVPFPVGLRPSSDHEPLSAPTPFITITTASTDGPPMKSFTIAPTFLGQALGIKLGFVFAVAKCFKERCSVLPKH